MEAFLSFIGLWPLSWAPRNWALCWGQTISITENPSLYALLGTNYGGDGRSTFAVPDFRGRVPVGYGYGIGLSPYPVLGQRGGFEGVALNVNQLPAHNHAAALASVSVEFKASDQPGTETIPGTNNAKTLASTDGRPSDKLYNTDTPTVALEGLTTNGGSVAVADTGKNSLHENRQPFLVTNYIICTEGIFPPRQ